MDERVDGVQAVSEEVRTSAIPPMDPEQTAEAVVRVGIEAEKAGEYELRDLCEERSCIEAFLRDGGLTEEEEALAQLWLRWDDVAHGIAWPGQKRRDGAATREYAEGMRGRAYRSLAVSYAEAAGPPGSKVRSGAAGGLVLTMEGMEDQGERCFDSGGAAGPGDVMAWLEGFVQGRGDDIAGELSRMGAYEETLRAEWVSLQRRKAVLEGERVVVGALVLAIEERNG